MDPQDKKKTHPNLKNLTRRATGARRTESFSEPSDSSAAASKIPLPMSPKAKRIDTEEIQKFKKAHKPIIGIIGLDRIDVANLNRTLVETCNAQGLGDDQEHPVIVAVGSKPKRSENKRDSLEKAAQICFDYGCDILVIATASSDSKEKGGMVSDLHEKYKDKMLVLDHKESLAKEQNREKFSQIILLEVVKWIGKIRTKNSLDYDPHQPSLAPKIIEAIEQNKAERTTRLKNSILKQEEYADFIGVLGGAGPAASAMAALLLAKNGHNFIHLSYTTAPGKHRFEMGEGPSYIPFYKEVTEYFEQIGVKFFIPCNTAHKRAYDYIEESQAKKFIDFRESFLSNMLRKGHDKIILLGTNATTGVGSGKEKGLYQKFLDQKIKEGHKEYEKLKIITPDEDEQKVIMDCIYTIKDGKGKILANENFVKIGIKKEMVDVKKVIDHVSQRIRRRCGDIDKKIPVNLGCTELPVPYDIDSIGFIVDENYCDTTSMTIEVINYQKELERISEAERDLRKIEAISQAKFSSPEDSASLSEGSSSDEEFKEKEEISIPSLAKEAKMNLYVEKNEKSASYRLTISGPYSDLQKKVRRLFTEITYGSTFHEKRSKSSKYKYIDPDFDETKQGFKISLHFDDLSKEGCEDWIKKNILNPSQEAGIEISEGVPPKAIKQIKKPKEKRERPKSAPIFTEVSSLGRSGQENYKI